MRSGLLISFLLLAVGSSFRILQLDSASSPLHTRTTRRQLSTPAHSHSQAGSSSNVIIHGIECRVISIDLNHSAIDRPIHLLEATAQGQETLVDGVLEDKDDDPAVTTVCSEDPYGAVLWPAALALSRYLLTHWERLGLANGDCSTVLELGTGTGLVSLTALLYSQQHRHSLNVVATDFEDLPLQLVNYAATSLNDLSESRSRLPLITRRVDLRQPLTNVPSRSVVVAADVLYEPKTGRALAQRVVEALELDCRVIVACSPGRPGRPVFVDALNEILSTAVEFENITSSTVVGQRHELICGKNSTSVSETPKELVVAILEVDPRTHFVDAR